MDPRDREPSIFPGDDDFYYIPDGNSDDSDSIRDTVDKAKDVKDAYNKSKKAKSSSTSEAGGKTLKNAPDAGENTLKDLFKGGKNAVKSGVKTGAEDAASAGAAAAKTGAAAAKAGTTAATTTAAAGEAATGVGLPLAIATLLADPNVRKGLKWGVKKIVGIILILFLTAITVFFILTSSQGISLKETLSETNGRAPFYTLQVRRSILRNDAFFIDPRNCGQPVYCRLTPGITKVELNKLKNQPGIIIDDKDIVDVGDGKYYLKKMYYINKTADDVSMVDYSTFPEKFRTDATLYTPLENITSNGSIFWRSKRSLERFSLYSMSRDNVYDNDQPDVDRLTSAFRMYTFTAQGRVASMGPDFEDTVKERASEVSSQKYGGVPETIIANTTGFDTPNNNTEIMKLIDADKTKKQVYEIFKGLTKEKQLCRFADAMDALNYNTKVPKARAIAKYAGHFLTMSDANKSGTVTSPQVQLMNGTQVAKSIAYDSYTKAFDQSEGYLLSSQGVFNDKPGTGGIVRSVTGGNPSFYYLNQIVGNLNYATPVSDTFSVYTTADLFIDRSTDEGCKKFYNSAKGVTQERVEMMALLMAEYAAPQFVLNEAAAISPDPKTDPEMGYGAGNAIAAGSSALTSGVARNLGMEALHYNDFKTQVERMNDSTHLPGAISEGSSTFDKVDNYRNNWCNDRTISGEKIATDAFCNIQWGYTDEVLLSDQFAPKNVVRYLLVNSDWEIGSPCYHDGLINANPMIQGPDGYNDPGVEQSPACIKAKLEGETRIPHIDGDGVIRTQRFQDYIDNCIRSDKAIIDQNKYAENQFGASSASYCAIDPDDIFRYFRLFVFDTNILDAEQQSINGTLGKDPAAANPAGAMPVGGGTATSGDASAVIAKVKEFAWEDGRRGGAQKTAYAEAVKRSAYGNDAAHKYGNDCGAFVYILMHESGFEPNYPATNTAGQLSWLNSNWTKIFDPGQVDTSQLQPGDIGIKNGHVFVWTGPVDGFVGTSAEAALGSNTAPTAITPSNTYSDPNNGYYWFRKP